ncbi:MAG: hypothetical protein D8M58_18710 [Calditrichaeota bacterium]|nr:MAG: hypothetical protein DWQ03_21390 [Calditrichota bacterium]MBL1207442.1 hypothetical protein [Calditrichota bacterium]NOG47274.1 hypothetical protein [Calditrichota bacterium]
MQTLSNINKYIIILLTFVLTISCVQKNSPVKHPKIIGPYVQMPGKDHAYIYWAENTNFLQKGVSFENLNSVDQIWTHHKQYIVATREAQESREIYYKIPGIGKGNFKFAPKDWSVPFNFVVFGDNKSWHTNQENSDEKYSKIIALVEEKKPEFIINTGDIVFEGRDYRDWEKFFEISGELMKNIPYFPVVGNHEESSEPLYNFFEFPNNKTYYSFNWGAAHFIVLNSSGFESLVERRKYPEIEWGKYTSSFMEKVEKPFFKEQLEWLISDLEGHKGFPYIFVAFHYPVYNTLDRKIENSFIINDDWKPLFKKYNVSAVFNGHNHHYHHVEDHGTHYLITAGAGAGIYSRKSELFPGEVKYAEDNHFILVSISSEESSFNVYNIDNEIIESFNINKRN